ncbi:MAG TPA: MDR family MFS transporter [Ktedonobacterales bacterium]|nr:MDR family MFS transporter [Ktedonobacterales bacterium]
MATVSQAAETPSQRPAAPEEGEEPLYSRRIQLLTMAGVLMVMLLATLDQTIVGTALPRVVADLNGFSEYAWVATAYLLTSTITVPIYGKLSDLFGRKWLLLFAVILFLAGSALSGASQTMTQLIFFRGFQGLGAGGLISIAIAVVGDIFTPRERAKWQGVTGSVSALASILGPALGGFLTDNLTWRWVFYVNLPIGVAAMLVLIFLMPTLRTGTGKAKIDYTGVALLIAGSVPLLLGFSWAGSQYDWNSPQIIGLFIGAVVASVAFVLYEGWLERRGGQPIIEPGLFKNSIFSVSTLVMVIFGMGLFGSIYYISLFAQGVVGFSATNSGFILTPLMITAIAGSIFSGQLVGRIGKYKLIAIIGAVISVVGMGLLLRLDVHSTSADVVVSMLVLGLGIGVSMSLYTLVVQNALPKKIGQASAGLMFFRSIGSTVGLAAMGSILNTAYPTAFKNALPAALRQPQVLSTFNNPQVLLQPGAQEQLHKAASAQGPQAVEALNSVLEAVKVGLSQSIHSVFLVSVIAAAVSLVVVFFLKEIPLRGPGKKREGAEIGEGQAEAEVAALPVL